MEIGISAETPPYENSETATDGGGGAWGVDTKVAKSQRNFSLPVRLIEKGCWVTAPHAGVKIKACGATLRCGCGPTGRAPHPRTTQEREVGGGEEVAFGGDGGSGVTLRSLAEALTQCSVYCAKY